MKGENTYLDLIQSAHENLKHIDSLNRVIDNIMKTSPIFEAISTKSFDDIFKLPSVVSIKGLDELLEATNHDYKKALEVTQTIADTHTEGVHTSQVITFTPTRVIGKVEEGYDVNKILCERISYDDGRIEIRYTKASNTNVTVTSTESIVEQKPVEDAKDNTALKPKMPKAFTSSWGKGTLDECVKMGLLNKDYKPVEILDSWEIALLADHLGTLLHIDTKWKTIGDYWRLNNDNLRVTATKYKDSNNSNLYRKYTNFNAKYLSKIR